MIQRASAVFVLLLFVIAPAPASTMEWLSGVELERSCSLFLDDPRSKDGALCLAFMQGFIAGSDATEGAVMDTAARSKSANESYAERAARTRVGTLRLQRLQASGLAEYCVDKDTPAVEVVKQITAYLEDHPEASDLTAYDAVREALVHSFPCDE
jgi:hypothetical protein